MKKSFVLKSFSGLTLVALAACSAAPDVARSVSDPLLAAPDFYDIPAAEADTLAGDDLATAAASIGEPLVIYVGEDSSDGPYSGFTPEPEAN